MTPNRMVRFYKVLEAIKKYILKFQDPAETFTVPVRKIWVRVEGLLKKTS
jgi:hypothetical protein